MQSNISNNKMNCFCKIFNIWKSTLITSKQYFQYYANLGNLFGDPNEVFLENQLDSHHEVNNAFLGNCFPVINNKEKSAEKKDKSSTFYDKFSRKCSWHKS